MIFMQQNGTIQTSDANDKTNIENTDLGLRFVSQLTPRKYKYVDGESDRTHYGLIAQEVKSVLDRYFERILAPIRSRIPALRIGMAGIDLSPLILIVGFNFVQPYILRVVC